MILDDILANKRKEVQVLADKFSGEDPRKLVAALPKPRDFKAALRKGKFSLIAEIKRASPSAGVIREEINLLSLAKSYEECGAAALSVLTDGNYFHGKLEDLKAAKESTTIPVLRKDFIIGPLQVYEARMAGADAVLLIVRILEQKMLADLIALAEELGMQALVEIHNASEAERVLGTKAQIIGINNRDLDTLEIDLNNTIKIINAYPKLRERILISESGIQTRADVDLLKKAGVDGILVGETLLKSKNVSAKIQELIG